MTELLVAARSSSAPVLQLQLEDDQGVNLGFESSLTLRRRLVWTYDPKIRLKTLAALVDHCQGHSAQFQGSSRECH